MKYLKRGDDAKFRVVRLTALDVDKFQEFHKDSVDYPEGCVIEIQKTDGTTFVEYGHVRQTVNVCSFGNCLYIPAQIPTARLWVRATDNPGMYYKVPLKLKVHDHNAYIMIPGRPKEVELVGDAYFEAAYELQRV